MATQEQIENFLGPHFIDPTDVSLSHYMRPKTQAPVAHVWDSAAVEIARTSMYHAMGYGGLGAPGMLARAVGLHQWWVDQGRYLPRHILDQLGIDPSAKTERELEQEVQKDRSRQILEFFEIKPEQGDPLWASVSGKYVDVVTRATVKSPEQQQKDDIENKLRVLSLEDLEYIRENIIEDVLSFPPELFPAVEAEIEVKKVLPTVLNVINEKPLTILLGTDFFNSLALGLPEFTSRKGISPAEILLGIDPGQTATALKAVSRVREMIMAEDPRLTTRLALGLGDTLADIIKFALLPSPSKLKAFAKLPNAVKAAIGVGTRAGLVELLEAPKEGETLDERAKAIAAATGLGALTGATLSLVFSGAKAIFQQIKDIPVSQQATRLLQEPGADKFNMTHAQLVRLLKHLKSTDPEQFAKTIGYKTPAKPVVSRVVERKILPTGFRAGMAEIEETGKFGRDIAKRAAQAVTKGEEQIAFAAAKAAAIKPVTPKKVITKEEAGPFLFRPEEPIRVIADPKMRQSLQAMENSVARLKTRLEQQKAKGELTLAKKTQAELLRRQKDIETLRARHEIKLTRTVEEAQAKLDKMRRTTEFKQELVADALSMVQAIPKDMRPDFIRRATQVKTPAGIQKLATEIDERIEKYQKRQAIIEVTKTFKDIENATRSGSIRFGKVPSPQREKLIALRDSVDFKKLTEAQEAKLESLQSHVQRMAIDLSGELSALDKTSLEDPLGFVPKKIIEQLNRLGRANINDMSTEDIRYLGIAARQIVHEASLKSKLLVREGLRPLDNQAIRRATESVSVTRARRKELARIAKGQPEEPETGKLAERWRRYKAAELDLESLAEIASGNERDDIMRLLSDDLEDGKRRASEKLIEMLDRFSDGVHKAGLNKLQQLNETVEVTLAQKKMKLTLAELIKLERHFRSPDNLRAIMKTKGWRTKSKEITYPKGMSPADRIIELNNALAVVRNDPMLSALAGDLSDSVNLMTSEAANEALLRLRGWGFPPDPHYTSRNRARPKKVGGKTGLDSVAAEDHGMFLPRTGGTDFIKIERWDTDILRQIETAAHLYGMGVPLRNTRLLVENADFQSAMIEAGHKETLDKMLLMLQRIQGTPTDASMVDMMGRYLQRSVAVAGLGWRVSSGVTASLSYPAILGEVTSPRALAISPIVTQGYLEKMWADSAILNLRARGHRINAEVGNAASQDAFSQLVLGRSSTIGDKSFALVQEGDNTAIGMIHKVSVGEILHTPRNGKDVDVYEWNGRDPADLPELTSEMEGGYPTNRYVRYAAARRAEYLTRRTQPMYDMQNRSGLLSDPGTIPRVYGIFRSALNAQWKVFARAVNQYAKSEKTVGDTAKLLQHIAGLTIAGTSVAIWKLKSRWVRQAAYKDALEAVGDFQFNEKDALRTAEDEYQKMLVESAKNLGRLSTLGMFAVKAGEIVANQLFGEGYNWNRQVFDNPAMELMQDASSLVAKWPAAIRATKTWAASRNALDNLALTPDDRTLAREFHEGALDDLVRTWKDALASTINVGVRLAQVPLVAPYQEWIKPIFHGTDIKIIRELTPNDMKDPNAFAVKVSQVYELRKRLKALDRAPTLAEKQTISRLDSLIQRLNKKAEQIQDIAEPERRRMEFQMLNFELDAQISEIERQLQ